MLINLSNHPTAEWGEKQLKLALTQYGEIIDVPFPAISPEANSDEIIKLAFDVVSSICSKYLNEKFTVHIMGELTFVFAVVNQFQYNGIKCVVSTTHRIADMSSNGDRIPRFQFIGFREYAQVDLLKRYIKG